MLNAVSELPSPSSGLTFRVDTEQAQQIVLTWMNCPEINKLGPKQCGVPVVSLALLLERGRGTVKQIVFLGLVVMD